MLGSLKKFSICLMRLFYPHDPDCEFDGLTRVFFFLIDFFPLIRLYDLSYISFREIILVSWLGLWFWWFNPCCLELFFLSIFFQLHLSTLGWLRIRLCNSFQFALYWVILISWSRSQVWHVNPGWLKLFF